ncbi:MAG: hypothetical protein JW854_14740 [Actinobacteria bacterium]|nr:hypothetical protein [Actinomycetota bacterium]
MDWFLWIIGFLILLTIAVIVQRRFKGEARRSAAEEELDRLRDKIALAEEKLASLTEGEDAYWDAKEELNELKAEEWLILTEWALIKAKKVEAYECPKCLGEGIDERSYICDFCKGAGIIRADRLYTRGWNVWDEDNRPEA